MARIFTTKFNFNDLVYDAIVTVITADEKLNFNIKVLDAELFDLIPGGHIRYQGEEGFKDLQVKNEMAQSLMHSIALSIDDHLIGR
jgi:hypothetical protein